MGTYWSKSIIVRCILILFVWGCVDEGEGLLQDVHNPLENPESGPPAGNPDGAADMTDR